MPNQYKQADRASTLASMCRKAIRLKARLLFISLVIVSGCSSAYIDNRAKSVHFKDGVFKNHVNMERGIWAFIKMRTRTEYAEWPTWIEAAEQPDPISRQSGDDLRLTVINHATALIQAEGYNILTDPIYSDRASPLSFAGPKRVRAPAISFEKLPKIDVVIISHDHYDHLDLPTITRLVARDNPKIYLGLGVGERLASMNNVTEMDWWQRVDVGKAFALSFVPVQHFSGRSLFDRSSTLWGGYVLEINGRKIYFGGDSGYANHYTETYKKFGPMDLSLLPIGAYAPRDFMGYYHLDPKQAVQAHMDLRSRRSVGIHYGTFQLTAEPIDEPKKLLALEKANAGVDDDEFITLEFGKPYIIQ